MVIERNRFQISWMIGLSFVFAGLIALVLSAPAIAAPPGPKATAGCTSPKEIVKFSGDGTLQKKGPFKVSGKKIRFRFSGLEGGRLEIIAEDVDGSPRSFSIGDENDDFQIDGITPERYTFEVKKQSGEITSYQLIIDDCGGGGSGNNVGDGNGSGSGGNGSAGDQYAPNVEITNIINVPGKDLPDTGGLPLLAILFSVVAGAGLLTAVVRRRY